MADQWTIPSTGPQHRREIPLTAERANPTLQPNIPAHQQGDDATVQNRSCPRCSEAQRTQVRLTTEYPVERQDPKPFGDAKIPYMNQDQNVNNRSETATIVPDREWATQTANTEDYAPVHERASSPSRWSTQSPTCNASIAERRRRLVGRYLDDPNVYVNTIRLEPGTSGELQVIITLGMADIV